MADKQKNLYDIFSFKREKDTSKPVSRILLAGYFNESSLQKDKIEIEPYLSESMKPYLDSVNGYLLIKGYFYLHLLQSQSPSKINEYIRTAVGMHSKQPALHNSLNVLYFSDENPDKLFKSWFCENIFQSGPILGDSDKTEQQISERNFEIYKLILDGAKKKLIDGNVKIANQCPLNVQDMSMLINKRFMSLVEYSEIYLEEVEEVNDGEHVFPVRPPILKNLQYLEQEDYTQYEN